MDVEEVNKYLEKIKAIGDETKNQAYPFIEERKIELPKEAEAYILEGQGKLRSRVMTLNGKPLTLGENDTLPELSGEKVSGKVTLTPGACAFFVL